MDEKQITEDQLQAKIYFWFCTEYPLLRHCFFHIPNGGYRNPREAAKFKAIGVTAGIPDMALVYQGNTHYFELKVGKNKLSEKQMRVHYEFGKQDIPVNMIYSLIDFKKVIKKLVGNE